MSEENLNYEEYAKSLSEQALELMPEYISADDKQYIANTIKQFIVVSLQTMEEKHPEYDNEQRIYVAQIVAEWTLKEAIEIINIEFSKELCNTLLQKIAWIVFQACENFGTNLTAEQNRYIESKIYYTISEYLVKAVFQKEIPEISAKKYIDDNSFYNKLMEEIKKEDDKSIEIDKEIEKEREQRYNTAYKEISQQILNNPFDAVLYYNRAFLNLSNGVDIHIIIDDLNKAIELKPDFNEAKEILNLIYEGRNDI